MSEQRKAVLTGRDRSRAESGESPTGAAKADRQQPPPETTDVQEPEVLRRRARVVEAVDLPAAEVALAGQPLLMSVSKTAELLGISRAAAYRCAAAGDLPTAHLGGRVYIVTAKLRELLEST